MTFRFNGIDVYLCSYNHIKFKQKYILFSKMLHIFWLFPVCFRLYLIRWYMWLPTLTCVVADADVFSHLLLDDSSTEMRNKRVYFGVSVGFQQMTNNVDHCQKWNGAIQNRNFQLLLPLLNAKKNKHAWPPSPTHVS